MIRLIEKVPRCFKKKEGVIYNTFFHLTVGVAGFEPTTPCSQSRCANRTALHPECLIS